MTETEHRPAEVGDETASVDFDKAPPASRFRLRAQLLDSGSQSRVLAESDRLQMKIRVYAAHEGENAMHAHHNQDHSFVVLQGQARFYGPRGETWDLENAGQLAAGGGQEFAPIYLGYGRVGGLLAMHEVVPVKEAKRSSIPHIA